MIAASGDAAGTQVPTGTGRAACELARVTPLQVLDGDFQDAPGTQVPTGFGWHWADRLQIGEGGALA